MPHQCVKCSKIYPSASEALLKGCYDCGGKFFFYIREEQLKKIEENRNKIPLMDLKPEEKAKIEKDVREIVGVEDEQVPIILDFESVRIKEHGKFELDLVNLFNQKMPVVYKLEEGKYIIDIATTFKKHELLKD
jgi:hypothetical protein